MNSPRFDVAVVGDNTIDRFLDEPELGDLVGGNALNVAVQLSLLGLRVGYFGAVGSDTDADIVRDAASARGVDITHLVTLPGATALTTIRRTGEGDRVFESEDFGVTLDYFPDEPALQHIASARWVHVGMLPASQRLGRAIAERAEVPISQDCSVSPDYHHLAVHFASAGESEEEAERIVSAALARSSELAVATLGARGALGAQGEHRWRVAAEPTTVIDTTGAGDSFMAGFIAARLRGQDVGEALRGGALRGAHTCRHVGGWPQLANDVERFT